MRGDASPFSLPSHFHDMGTPDHAFVRSRFPQRTNRLSPPQFHTAWIRATSQLADLS
jgi:hypothetical protein